jgi:hypothetical protein
MSLILDVASLGSVFITSRNIVSITSVTLIALRNAVNKEMESTSPSLPLY